MILFDFLSFGSYDAAMKKNMNASCFAAVLVLSLAVLAANVEEPVAAAISNAPAAVSCRGTNVAGERIEEYLSPGEAIVVSPARRFTIRLRSNPTTGYGWQLAKPLDGKVVELVTNDYIPPADRRIGAGGHEAWTFKAVGQGRGTIALKYVRPWETNQPPAETNEFTVIVK